MQHTIMIATAGYGWRSEEHTSELQSHSEISYAVCCLKKKIYIQQNFSVDTDHLKDWLGIGVAHKANHALTAAVSVFFFFNDTATTEIYTLSYTLSLHDALPI